MIRQWNLISALGWATPQEYAVNGSVPGRGVIPTLARAEWSHAQLRRSSRGWAGIFPNEPAIRRLVGALMLEQNDEWAVSLQTEESSLDPKSFEQSPASTPLPF